MADSLHSGLDKTFSDRLAVFQMFKNGTWRPSLTVTTLALSCATILILVAGNIGQAIDYIGADNDDVMRLVQVRDFLAGQSWFDMHQYRLGLDGGTLMHWSRLIDAPIALLISFFSLFLSSENAEMAGVSIWPLMLVFPLIWACGRGGFHLGGASAMLIAQILGALFIVTVHRFHPGSIDHHNAQMALVATIVAMLLDPEKKTGSFVIAGFAASLALAIGVETTPLIAIMSALIAVLWGVYGEAYRKAATAYGLSLSGFVALAFFATTPVSLYAAVTCDNLSIGFASLAIGGGVSLAIAATLASTKSMAIRAVSLGISGTFVAGLLLKIAPQCLHNPLDSLDPLLQTMWLQNVQEAQTFISELSIDPYTMGTFYSVGFLSIVICTVRIWRKEAVAAHVILLVLAIVSFMIACYQIRAAIFSNIIAIFPLSMVIADLRRSSNENPKDVKRGLAFIAIVLASVPAIWGVSGILIKDGVEKIKGADKSVATTDNKICREKADMQQLASLPAGVVASPSNLGAHILRYTSNRVLAAPYHRNPKGMLTELNLELALPADAEKILRANGVNYYALCTTDHETGVAAEKQPDGFAANLLHGKVPDYLEKLPMPAGSKLTVYVVKPAAPMS